MKSLTAIKLDTSKCTHNINERQSLKSVHDIPPNALLRPHQCVHSATGTIVPPVRVFRKYKELSDRESNLEKLCVLNCPFISPLFTTCICAFSDAEISRLSPSAGNSSLTTIL